jgi:diaminohydroxyphosphoribosylaminopyrimidine deaminase / 5-amino-6-(5-phosphoribosylamino)uracil reductase
VVQLLVEGGATVAHDFHQAGLVDRYVLYLAPVLLGGDDGRPVFAGSGAASIDDVWRGRILSVTQLGEDVRIELAGTGTPARVAGARTGTGTGAAAAGAAA